MIKRSADTKKRNFIFYFIELAFICVFLFSCQKQNISSTNKQVEELLNQMTLEEKVSQMTQITVDVISKGKNSRAEPHEIDLEKLEKAIVDYHIGST